MTPRWRGAGERPSGALQSAPRAEMDTDRKIRFGGFAALRDQGAAARVVRVRERAAGSGLQRPAKRKGSHRCKPLN